MQIPVVRNVLEANEKMADNVRRLLTEKGILSLNLISSPGAGKTTLLERTLSDLAGEFRMQLLLGKLIPYFCMGMFSMALCAVAAVTLFAVPFRGSLWVLVLLSSVFMLSALGQGLLISVTLRGQLVAAEAGLFSGFLPALLLSGFVFDINSMPPVLQALTRLLPASYFNTCLRTIFLTGDVWGVFGPSLLFMLEGQRRNYQWEPIPWDDEIAENSVQGMMRAPRRVVSLTCVQNTPVRHACP